MGIKTVQLDGVTTLFQCLCSDHLRYEAEYGLKRGTTSNLYLLKDGNEGLLIDVPRKEYLDVFCAPSQLLQWDMRSNCSATCTPWQTLQSAAGPHVDVLCV